MHVKTLLIEA